MFILIRFYPLAPPFFKKRYYQSRQCYGWQQKKTKTRITSNQTLVIWKDWANLIWKHCSFHIFPLMLSGTKDTKKKKNTSTQTAKKFSFQSSPICDSNEGETKYGTRERKPCSPRGSDSSDHPGDLLEQRATGGEQPSEKRNSRPLMVSLFTALCSQCRDQKMLGQLSQLPRSLASQ